MKASLVNTSAKYYSFLILHIMTNEPKSCRVAMSTELEVKQAVVEFIPGQELYPASGAEGKVVQLVAQSGV